MWQSGKVQVYAIWFLVGVIALVVGFVFFVTMMWSQIATTYKNIFMVEYSAVVLKVVDTFKDKINKLAEGFVEEARYFIDSGLPEYIQTQNDKFSKTKTFLFRNDPIDFYKTYFSINLLNAKEDVLTIDEDIWLPFETNKCMLITGDAGSGKTMLLKHFFLQTLETYIKIPIVVELRNLKHKETSFLNYVGKLILDKNLATGRIVLERLLEEGMFFFLLDGYDEIYSEEKTEITEDLDKFIDKYNRNFFLMTSRPGANFESIPRFAHYSIDNLDNKQIEDFVIKQTSLMSDPQLGAAIVEAIKKPDNRDYKYYLSNPLLLSMFILAFKDHPILPKQKSKFYWNVFDTLCSRHDSITKLGGWQHERRSDLSNEDFEMLLKYFSYKSYFDGVFSFDRKYLSEKISEIKNVLGFQCSVEDIIYDLTVSISILTVDGLEYKFPHRTLQEYFTAAIISRSPEEKKQSIYSGPMTKVSSFSLDGYRNMWSLCEELDELSFYKYFLLPPFKSLFDILEKPLTDKEYLKTYYQRFVFSDHIIIDEGEVKHTTIWYSVNRLSNIANYLGIYYLINAKIDIPNGISEEDELIANLRTRKFTDENPVDEEHYDMYGVSESDTLYELTLNYDHFGFKKDIEDDFFEWATSIKLIDVVKESVNKLKEKVYKIESSIQRKYDNRASLLDL